MAHAAHYLEQVNRLDGAQLDLAMALYRDPALVRAIIAGAGLRPGEENVAIALAAGRYPPHIIVKRTGAFVTCLGPRMLVRDATIVPKGKLDAIAARQELVGERVAAVRALVAAGKGFTAMLSRLERAGPTLSREEISALVAYEPLFRHQLPGEIKFYVDALKAGSVLLATRGPLDELVGLFGRSAWTLGHLFVLAQAPGALGFLGKPEWARWFTMRAAQTERVPGLLGPFLRATWAVARMGKPALRFAKELFRHEGETHVRSGATFLAALALGHGQLRGEVRKALAVGSGERTPLDSLRRELAARLLPLVERGGPPPEYEAVARERWAALGPSFARTEPAPEDLLAAIATQDLALSTDEAQRELELCLATLVRARPEDLYLPAAHASALGTETVAAVSDAAARWRRELPALEPVVGGRVVARNQPCPCGSGRKYKRCCGA